MRRVDELRISKDVLVAGLNGLRGTKIRPARRSMRHLLQVALCVLSLAALLVSQAMPAQSRTGGAAPCAARMMQGMAMPGQSGIHSPEESRSKPPCCMAHSEDKPLLAADGWEMGAVLPVPIVSALPAPRATDRLSSAHTIVASYLLLPRPPLRI